jgi:molybdopterin molybdotransferase
MSSMKSPRIGFRADALLAPAEAIERYFSFAQLREPQIERVPLAQARGRVLAAALRADADYPAAARSAMDGFALRAAQTPVRLRIAGEVRVGVLYAGTLPAGAAVRIPTGGVLPAGADAVVPIEDVRVEQEAVLAPPVGRGDCVTPAGSDMRRGETLLAVGRRIAGPEMGLLATVGTVDVPVFRRPLIAVLSSGDELVDAAQLPDAAQVRDSNRWAIAGTLEAMGAGVRHLPRAPDNPDTLEALLREALETCDAVALSGGSSVGERDFTPRIVQRLGLPGVIVHGLRVKPGKPTLLASAGGKPVIGLPGNPASALTILEAVAAPIVYRLTGAEYRTRGRRCRLGAPLRKRAGWTWFVPVRLDEAAAEAVAYPLEMRSSSASLLARAGGYAEVAEDVEALEAGAEVFVRSFTGS